MSLREVYETTFTDLHPYKKEVSNMREKVIEHHLVMETEKAGGKAVKLVSPSFAGMPDRLILLADGKMGFVEVHERLFGNLRRTLTYNHLISTCSCAFYP